jgi:hypothetical protein
MEDEFASTFAKAAHLFQEDGTKLLKLAIDELRSH